MDFLQPTTWSDALALRADRADALPIAGGTDVMVDLNFDRRRPGALLDLGRVGALREWGTDDGRIRLGAGVMIVGGLVAAFIGVSAEGKSLEDVATPLSMRRPGTRAEGAARPSL